MEQEPVVGDGSNDERQLGCQHWWTERYGENDRYLECEHCGDQAELVNP